MNLYIEKATNKSEVLSKIATIQRLLNAANSNFYAIRGISQHPDVKGSLMNLEDTLETGCEIISVLRSVFSNENLSDLQREQDAVLSQCSTKIPGEKVIFAPDRRVVGRSVDDQNIGKTWKISIVEKDDE